MEVRRLDSSPDFSPTGPSRRVHQVAGSQASEHSAAATGEGCRPPACPRLTVDGFQRRRRGTGTAPPRRGPETWRPKGRCLSPQPILINAKSLLLGAFTAPLSPHLLFRPFDAPQPLPLTSRHVSLLHPAGKAHSRNCPSSRVTMTHKMHKISFDVQYLVFL